MVWKDDFTKYGEFKLKQLKTQQTNSSENKSYISG